MGRVGLPRAPSSARCPLVSTRSPQHQATKLSWGCRRATRPTGGFCVERATSRAPLSCCWIAWRSSMSKRRQSGSFWFGGERRCVLREARCWRAMIKMMASAEASRGMKWLSRMFNLRGTTNPIGRPHCRLVPNANRRGRPTSWLQAVRSYEMIISRYPSKAWYCDRWVNFAIDAAFQSATISLSLRTRSSHAAYSVVRQFSSPH
jgi:hypothetical protein